MHVNKQFHQSESILSNEGHKAPIRILRTHKQTFECVLTCMPTPNSNTSSPLVNKQPLSQAYTFLTSTCYVKMGMNQSLNFFFIFSTGIFPIEERNLIKYLSRFTNEEFATKEIVVASMRSHMTRFCCLSFSFIIPHLRG